ncbi:MAG: sensor histidine kinase, partial [Rhodanobacteraceae bacterium]
RMALRVSNGEARLVIEDNGCGGVIAPGNGLTGMRERLRALGGDLAIVSEPGRFTRLDAWLPIPEPGAAIASGRIGAPTM